jgi:Beta-glucosidase/6-phospho-beta-glucosidase/beta-galactosidase
VNKELPKPFDRFAWSGGIENTFIPDERPGLRALEEFDLMQHYQQWQSDLDRAASLGIAALRWGPPWYRVEPKDGEFDWSWTDEVLTHMIDKLGITPILDLVHYGTPAWLEGSFASERYPERVAAYAAAFAARYKGKVRFYTALNEPTVNADFSGRRAEWPPYLTGDQGYVSILVSIAQGIQRTVKVIREQDPDAIFVAVESMRCFRAKREAAKAVAELCSLQDYLCWDLVSGTVSEPHALHSWLIANGASQEALSELACNGVHQDVFGVNFYPWAYAEVDVDAVGAPVVTYIACTGAELEEVLKQAARHTGKPVLVTETSANGSFERRCQWMRNTVEAVARARAADVDVIGYTWFPLFTMIGWEYRKSDNPIDEHLLHLGLWDCAFDAQRVLVRQSTQMVEEYIALVKAGAPMLEAGSM